MLGSMQLPVGSMQLPVGSMRLPVAQSPPLTPRRRAAVPTPAAKTPQMSDRPLTALKPGVAQTPQMRYRPLAAAQTPPYARPYAVQSASMQTPNPRNARLSAPAVLQLSMPTPETFVPFAFRNRPSQKRSIDLDRTIERSQTRTLDDDAAAQNIQAIVGMAVGQMDEEARDGQVTKYMHGIHTAQSDAVQATRALRRLQEGNERFVDGTPVRNAFGANSPPAVATNGQRPMATIIGCADSRYSAEIVFDAQPGDLFVLRPAGNTVTIAQGSTVRNAEHSVCNLGTQLIVVLGHTHCAAIAGATKCMLDRKASKAAPCGPTTTLQSLIADLEPIAAQAQFELGADANAEDIAELAVYVNVFHTMEKLLAYSEPISQKCREGALEIHGAVHNTVSGRVGFVGQHPRLPFLLGSQSGFVRIVQNADAEGDYLRAQGA